MLVRVLREFHDVGGVDSHETSGQGGVREINHSRNMRGDVSEGPVPRDLQL